MPGKNWSSRLRHRVVLQEPTLTADTGGGYVRGWADVASLWARLEPLSNREATTEKLGEMRIQARTRFRIWVRYRENVNADMRLMYGTRALYILSVVNTEEKGEVLELVAEEGAAA